MVSAFIAVLARRSLRSNLTVLKYKGDTYQFRVSVPVVRRRKDTPRPSSSYHLHASIEPSRNWYAALPGSRENEKSSMYTY